MSSSSGYPSSTGGAPPPEPLPNPEVFVRRLYKPRLFDQVRRRPGATVLPPYGWSASPHTVHWPFKPLRKQVTIDSGVVPQLSSLSRRVKTGEGLHTLPLGSEVPQSDYGLQSGLALPEEFGKIYLGETFRAFVSVVNTLSVPIVIQEAQISVKSNRAGEVSGVGSIPASNSHRSRALGLLLQPVPTLTCHTPSSSRLGPRSC